ncbi:MAG: family 10 glycosylhydrolase, partial [Bergeyella zoohelcum]|nr:family 10 glycosylhydrolase [Bergeyella zoohelcum]
MEAIRILDLLKSLHFNAVVFQVRPSADAFYKSDLEPWSYFLTGEIGKAPNPYYDPLEFWIEEAHKRGLLLHIWLNPYRVHHTSGGELTAKSMVNKLPEQSQKLKNGMYWLDPSDQKTQDHTSKIINDLVKRYDIDAVHIDDYFYPYAEYHGGKDFPDDRTWNAYKNAGGTLSRADWRRANVNKFIKRINDEIKAEKSWVQFGISPFGIWKSGYPADVKGLSQYDALYADAKLWLNEGWLDYFAPQLYWKDGGPQSFSSLLRWWQEENYKQRHLWAGLNTVAVKAPNKSAEIVKQIELTRQIVPQSKGAIHYSMAGITNSYEMQMALRNIYQKPAIVPKSSWIKVENIEKPQFDTNKISADFVEIKPKNLDKTNVFKWILYKKYGETWETEIVEKNIFSVKIEVMKQGKKLNTIAVKYIDRLGNESDYTAVTMAK